MSGRSLYRQILGSAFGKQHSSVQRFHSLQGTHRLEGRCSIRGAEHAVGKMICALLRLPRQAEDAEFSFVLSASDQEETWMRQFRGCAMRSTLRRAADGMLEERIGRSHLGFSLSVTEGRMAMHLERIHLSDLPWPTRWIPEFWAIKHGDQDRFHVDVGARFRRHGLLVAYSGHLDLPKKVNEL